MCVSMSVCVHMSTSADGDQKRVSHFWSLNYMPFVVSSLIYVLGTTLRSFARAKDLLNC